MHSICLLQKHPFQSPTISKWPAYHEHVVVIIVQYPALFPTVLSLSLSLARSPLATYVDVISTLTQISVIFILLRLKNFNMLLYKHTSTREITILILIFCLLLIQHYLIPIVILLWIEFLWIILLLVIYIWMFRIYIRKLLTISKTLFLLHLLIFPTLLFFLHDRLMPIHY